MKKMMILATLMSLLTACNSKDSAPISGVRSHPVSMQLGTYSTARWQNLLIPSAHAAVSDLTVCFKRLRFKQDLNDDSVAETSDDNVDLSLGLVTLSNVGTSLGTVNVPAGTYQRIEFDLEPDCNGKSVELTNDYGTFSMANRITIRFEGSFVVDGAETLELGVQNILNAANAHDGTGNLDDELEAISGDL